MLPRPVKPLVLCLVLSVAASAATAAPDRNGPMFEFWDDEATGSRVTVLRIEVERPTTCDIRLYVANRQTDQGVLAYIERSVDGGPRDWRVAAAWNWHAHAHAAGLDTRPATQRAVEELQYGGGPIYGQSLLADRVDVRGKVTYVLLAASLDPRARSVFDITKGHTYGFEVECDGRFHVLPVGVSRELVSFTNGVGLQGTMGASLMFGTESATVDARANGTFASPQVLFGAIGYEQRAVGVLTLRAPSETIEWWMDTPNERSTDFYGYVGEAGGYEVVLDRVGDAGGFFGFVAGVARSDRFAVE